MPDTPKPGMLTMHVNMDQIQFIEEAVSRYTKALADDDAPEVFLGESIMDEVIFKAHNPHSAHLPSHYHAIRLHGERMKSMDYYIRQEQWRAAAMNAPLDALYLQANDVWSTVSNMASDAPFRAAYQERMHEIETNAAELAGGEAPDNDF